MSKIKTITWILATTTLLLGTLTTTAEAETTHLKPTLKTITTTPKIKTKTPTYTKPGKTIFGLNTSTITHLKKSTKSIKTKPGIIGIYTGFTDAFPTEMANYATKHNALLMISWEPGLTNEKSYNLKNIINGDYDTQIKQFGTEATKINQPILVRWAAEANGNWNPWSPGLNNNTTTDYQNAWKHIVDTIKQNGNTNIKWGFNPIVSYEGSTPLKQLWPGTNYVDWIGLDGYNWGKLKPWGWKKFNDIFTAGINELKTLTTTKPLILAEIGTAPGKKQATWVKDALTQTQKLGARGIVWFDFNKETDWRLGTKKQVKKITKQTLKKKTWIKGGNLNKIRKTLGY